MSTNNSSTTDFIKDKDVKSGTISGFQLAVKCYDYFYHIVFLECCKHVGVRPNGLLIDKSPFISFISHDIEANWKETVTLAEEQLLDTLVIGIAEKMLIFEEQFWNDLVELERNTNMDDLIEWFVKLKCHLDKLERKTVKRKKNKLKKLIIDRGKLQTALKRFEEHLDFFDFKTELQKHGSYISPDIENIITLATLDDTFIDRSESNSTTMNTTLSEETLGGEETSFDSAGTAEDFEGRLRGKFVSANIFNLSKRSLSKAEISLLGKGLKFVPTTKFVDQALIKQDLEKFGRRLRLAWQLRNDERGFDPNPFKPKSNFNPKNKDTAIELYLSTLEEEILKINTKLRYSNVTKEERQAIDSLRNDPTIIIKEADKGSGIVIWDREDYLKEAQKQLGETEVYEKLVGDAVSPLIKVVKDCLAKIKIRGDICKDTLDYFLVKNPKLGRFYLLPKIHKRLFNVPGRPVISNSGFYTENISAFLDYHLKPLSQQVKSFVKDTNDFLKKIANLPPLPEDVLMCTIDVVGLYPNIPHKDGLEALKLALDSREDKNISTESLLELAKCVLENNVFEHNGAVYKQKQGTAIGTKMAPSYAILFMSYLEENLLSSFPLKPLVWWRYIDDIFLLWEHGEEQLKNFLQYINSAHQTIKFTADYSTDKINFLDVEVIRRGDTLLTDLYVKQTDTHQYLDASSCHPNHCKNSIPFSQALRLNRICSEQKFYDQRCNDLETWLLSRGYDEKLVRRKILEARRFKRIDLLNKKKVDKKDHKITLNLTYHPAFQSLRTIMHKLHVILSCNKEHQKVFKHIPLIGFRNAKNLKDFLVRAKVPPLTTPEGASETCAGRLCKMCSFVKCTNSFESKDGVKYVIRNCKLNCGSKNVVYLLNCKTCNVQYVGSCTTPFRKRFANYKSCYNRHRAQTVPQQNLHNHFDLPGHNGLEDWEFILIDQADNEASVRKKERFWQYKLNTFLPNGLNDCEVNTMS